MLSRVIRKTSSNSKNFGFSLGSRLFNLPNTSYTHYGTANESPLVAATQANVVQSQDTAVSVTQLENGITVVSETPEMPGTVGVQVLLGVGTRDETMKTSGSLLSIKNTYYKTVLNTNEAVNYGMVQMAGGEFTMDYDQETSLFKAHCLEHDVVDILRMVCDCALEPRSATAANVGIYKNKNSHAMESSNNTGIDLNDTLFRTAYGLKGLGMPLMGVQSNVEYLNASVLQKFQMDNISPEKIVVGGSNVENHQELVELVEDKLGFIPVPEGQVQARETTEYLGGEVRVNDQTNRMDVVVAYQTQGWTAPDALALGLASTILGQYSSFSLDLPHVSPATRAYRQLVGQLSYVDDAASINFNFSDSGLFGIRLGGVASEGQSLFAQAAAQLQSLTSEVTEQELQAAKNALSLQILRGLETPDLRMTETLRNIHTFGKPVHATYLDQVQKVTVQDVQAAVAQVIAGTPTVVVSGGQASTVNTSL